MGRQYLKVLAEPEPRGDICPRCGKKRANRQCSHHGAGPHRGGCHRLHRGRKVAVDGHHHQVEVEQGENDLTRDTGPGRHPSSPEGSLQRIPDDQHLSRTPSDPVVQGLSCAGPQCVNLNFLRELRVLNRSLAMLQSQEKSLVRYLARVDHDTVQEFVLFLLLEPVFESIEKAYMAADELRQHIEKDPSLGSPCPYVKLIQRLDQRLRTYLKLENGLDGEAGAAMAELFGEEEISPAQILADLSPEPRQDQYLMSN